MRPSSRGHCEQNNEEWIWRGIDHFLPASPYFISVISPRSASNKNLTASQLDLHSKVVASFNCAFTRDNSPFMVIPGCPDQYVPWQGGTLTPSSEPMFVDQNAACNEKYPLESLFRAVNVCSEILDKPDFKWSSIDLCTDRNNLRKLFAIASGSRKRYEGPVRVDIERVGKTVMLTRFERTNKLETGRANFGHPFEHVATRRLPGVRFTRQPGDGSFRCVKLVEFAGLRMMVRFEVDCADYGNLPRDLTSHWGNSIGSLPAPRHFDASSPLAYSIAPKPTKSNDGYAGLPVENVRSLVELASTSQPSVLSRKWPQMYFSGTNKLVVGYHKNGNFTKVEELTLSQVEQRMNGRPLGQLEKFGLLLQSLVDVVRTEREGQLLTAVWDPSSPHIGADELLIGRRDRNAYVRAAPPNILMALKKG